MDRGGKVLKNVGIIVNRERKNALDYAISLVNWLEEKNIKVFVTDWLGRKINRQELIADKREIGEKANLIISLGGDGTLFRVARDFSPYQIPLLGINLGGLGFLTEIPVSQFKEGLTKIMTGRYKIEKRLMLEAIIYRDKRKIGTSLALNDFVISKVALSRLVNLKTFVSGEFITTYSADGLIISTPTGSTAYSLSAGGPIVQPNLGIIILSPICAHTLAVRPLIISENDVVEVILEHPSSKVMLTVDGQIGFDLKDKDIIRVKKASCQAKLIRLEEKAFFEVLQSKLGWSGISRKNLK
ncbi:NAD(+) kinase [Candidatus Aerophobetes bacterium]|uniref:NAD kinase n=1 Tax=Aerophobetes bacterium TaxID=2030807 RepID=A0A662D6G0_UNCAE|nr:MAG: NAD(+) kinase [Candidatus Aerophobetes bacterium]